MREGNFLVGRVWWEKDGYQDKMDEKETKAWESGNRVLAV